MMYSNTFSLGGPGLQFFPGASYKDCIAKI